MKGKVGRLLLALVAAAAVMAGCATEVFDDGYQFGDVTKSVGGGVVQALEWRHEYCNGGSQTAKKALLGVIKAVAPDYPEDGICAESKDALATLLADQDDGS